MASVKERADALVDEGLRLYAQGDLDAALLRWRSAIKLIPDHRRAREYFRYVRDNRRSIEDSLRTAEENASGPLGALAGIGGPVASPGGPLETRDEKTSRMRREVLMARLAESRRLDGDQASGPAERPVPAPHPKAEKPPVPEKSLESLKSKNQAQRGGGSLGVLHDDQDETPVAPVDPDMLRLTGRTETGENEGEAWANPSGSRHAEEGRGMALAKKAPGGSSGEHRTYKDKSTSGELVLLSDDEDSEDSAPGELELSDEGPEFTWEEEGQVPSAESPSAAPRASAAPTAPRSPVARAETRPDPKAAARTESSPPPKPPKRGPVFTDIDDLPDEPEPEPERTFSLDDLDKLDDLGDLSDLNEKSEKALSLSDTSLDGMDDDASFAGVLREANDIDADATPTAMVSEEDLHMSEPEADEEEGSDIPELPFISVSDGEEMAGTAWVDQELDRLDSLDLSDSPVPEREEAVPADQGSRSADRFADLTLDSLEVTEDAQGSPLDEAEELAARGNLEEAHDLCRRLLSEDPSSVRTRALQADLQARLLQTYRQQIGDPTQVPSVLVPRHQIVWQDLDNRTGFLLSRIDGLLTFEDIIDISGMSEFEACRTLVRLLESELIGSK